MLPVFDDTLETQNQPNNEEVEYDTIPVQNTTITTTTTVAAEKEKTTNNDDDDDDDIEIIELDSTDPKVPTSKTQLKTENHEISNDEEDMTVINPVRSGLLIETNPIMDNSSHQIAPSSAASSIGAQPALVTPTLNAEPESIIGDAIYDGQQFFMIKQRNCIEFILSKFSLFFLKDLWYKFRILRGQANLFTLKSYTFCFLVF